MSAIPTIWFLLKLLWTHRTHLGNYASYNAGLTCQRTAQGQPGDCDKSALTSSKLIWPGADCWQLIILAIPSSKEVKGRWKRMCVCEWRKVSGGEGGERRRNGSLFLSPIFWLVFTAQLMMNSEMFYIYWFTQFSVNIWCSVLFEQGHIFGCFGSVLWTLIGVGCRLWSFIFLHLKSHAGIGHFCDSYSLGRTLTPTHSIWCWCTHP